MAGRVLMLNLPIYQADTWAAERHKSHPKARTAGPSLGSGKKAIAQQSYSLLCFSAAIPGGLSPWKVKCQEGGQTKYLVNYLPAPWNSQLSNPIPAVLLS